MKKLLFILITAISIAFVGCQNDVKDNSIPTLKQIQNFSKYKALAAGQNKNKTMARSVSVIGGDSKLMGVLEDDSLETVIFETESGTTSQTWNLSVFNATDNYTLLGFTRNKVESIDTVLREYDANYLLDKKTGKLYALNDITFSSASVEGESTLFFNGKINSVEGLYKLIINGNNIEISLIAEKSAVDFNVQKASVDRYGNVIFPSSIGTYLYKDNVFKLIDDGFLAANRLFYSNNYSYITENYERYYTKCLNEDGEFVTAQYPTNIKYSYLLPSYYINTKEDGLHWKKTYALQKDEEGFDFELKTVDIKFSGNYHPILGYSPDDHSIKYFAYDKDTLDVIYIDQNCELTTILHNDNLLKITKCDKVYDTNLIYYSAVTNTFGKYECYISVDDLSVGSEIVRNPDSFELVTVSPIN